MSIKSRSARGNRYLPIDDNGRIFVAGRWWNIGVDVTKTLVIWRRGHGMPSRI
jgi:hypothetical protein